MTSQNNHQQDKIVREEKKQYNWEVYETKEIYVSERDKGLLEEYLKQSEYTKGLFPNR